MKPEGLKKYQIERKLTVGTIILIVTSFLLIIFSFIGISTFIYIPFLTVTIYQVLSVILGSIIIIGSVYVYYREKYRIFGYFLCLTGNISNLIIVFISRLYNSLIGYKSIVFIILVFFGLFLYREGILGGSKICIIIGAVDLILQLIASVLSWYLLGYFVGGGFFNLFLWVHIEPILILIGGLFLYYDRKEYL